MAKKTYLYLLILIYQKAMCRIFFIVFISVFLIIPLTVIAQSKVQFGFNSGLLTAEFIEEVDLYHLKKASLSPNEVRAVLVKGTDDNLFTIADLHSAVYLYLDETFTTNSYYLNDEKLKAFFAIVGKSSTLRYISCYDSKLLQYLTNPNQWRGIELYAIEPLSFKKEILRFQNLDILNVNDPELKSFPYTIAHLDNLVQLQIKSSNLITLPPIRELQNLIVLKILCGAMRVLPEGIDELKRLRYLSVTGVSLITEFPIAACTLDSLEILELDARNIQALPDEIGNLKALRNLKLNETKKLTSLPTTMGKLQHLEEVYFSRFISMEWNWLATLNHPITIVLNQGAYKYAAKSIADYKQNVSAVALPSNILDNELAQVKKVLPENLIKTFKY